MSIIPASSLSRADLRSLGNNVIPTIDHDRLSVGAVNRSLSLHEESVRRLFRRAGTSRCDRLRTGIPA
jgi:hypothetical protein